MATIPGMVARCSCFCHRICWTYPFCPIPFFNGPSLSPSYVFLFRFLLQVVLLISCFLTLCPN